MPKQRSQVLVNILIAALLLLCALGAMATMLGWEARADLDPGSFRAQEGHCFFAPAPLAWLRIPPFSGDSLEDAQKSRLRLFEDNQPLGPGHAPHSFLRMGGRGAFSHWGEWLYFSASDNSDPRTNNKAYRVSYPLRPPPAMLLGCLAALGGLVAFRLKSPNATDLPTNRFRRFSGWMLAFLSVAAALALGELLLSGPSARRIGAIPLELQRKPAVVPGAYHAHYWHGALHVFDRNGMRRTKPFPPKQGEIFRIMVVGDSFTYGKAVKESEAYPAVLEKMLGKKFRVEVNNLGVQGFQSSQILEVVSAFLPKLTPDLVVYGMCLNDFLPPGTGAYENSKGYSFPLPEAWKTYLSQKSGLCRLLEKAYDGMLMRMGLREDFYGAVQKNFHRYRARFAEDTFCMNRLVTDAGLPAIVAMVLDQTPDCEPRDAQVAGEAEHLMREAGLDLIASAGYRKKYRGQALVASPWDGHPGPLAHRVFAGELAAHIERLPALEAFRIRSAHH